MKTTRPCRTLNRRMLICGLVLAAMSHAAQAATSAGGITLVSPADGATVAPGTALALEVQLDAAISPETVSVWTAKGLLPPHDFTQPPYQATIAIPEDFTGTLELHAFVRTTTMGFVDGPTITVNVVPPQGPASLEATRARFLSFPVDGEVANRAIAVTGIFAGGVRRNVGQARFGTSFSSSDPTVVTVDANGILTATGTGLTYVTVANGAARAYTQVVVGPPDSTAFPIVDVTGSVAISPGGFRRDPETGLFVQQLTLQNTSVLPIPSGLRLVVSNLPDGVSLTNANGKTRSVAPLGSPYRFAQAGEEVFLSPGSTATALLQFRNPEGIPITHSLQVFIGTGL